MFSVQFWSFVNQKGREEGDNAPDGISRKLGNRVGIHAVYSNKKIVIVQQNH